MSILKVARMGHPVLRTKARAIDRSEITTAPMQKLIDNMLDTMAEYHGVGLAAPQVHEGLRIFVASLDAGEDADEHAEPQVIINRFEQKLFSSGLRKADIEQVLGESFAACIPNHYGLVREAIDRGIPLDEVKPGNKITAQLKKLIMPQPVAKPAAQQAGGTSKKFKLSWAR